MAEVIIDGKRYIPAEEAEKPREMATALAESFWGKGDRHAADPDEQALLYVHVTDDAEDCGVPLPEFIARTFGSP